MEEGLRFVDSNESKYLKTIQEFIERSKKIDIAVAFWGKNAIENLKLTKDKDIRILCSLKNGISNVDVIKELMGIYKEKIKHCDNLHAKVFLFDDKVAIVGSANASTYGLPSTEQEENKGWIEAGMVVSNHEVVGQIRDWFNDIFDDEKKARKIETQDIIEAENRRKLYRGRTLFETLESNPDFFKDRNWQMAI